MRQSEHPVTIERIDNPSPETFRRRYLSRGHPVILRGIADAWAARRWTPEFFEEKYPRVEIGYETWEGDESTNDPLEFAREQRRGKIPFADFVRLVRAGGPSRKNYCTQFVLFDAIPELRHHVASLDAYMGHEAYPEAVRKRLQMPATLWFGPEEVVSTAHFDRSDNFNLQLFGRKKWTLFPPEASDALYYPCADLPTGLLHFSPVDIEHPDLRRFPKFAHARPIEFVLEPGELLFLPAGFWHHVRGLETSLSMNFFFFRPFATPLLLRRFLFHLARRVLLTKLGANHLSSEVRVVSAPPPREPT